MSRRVRRPLGVNRLREKPTGAGSAAFDHDREAFFRKVLDELLPTGIPEVASDKVSDESPKHGHSDQSDSIAAILIPKAECRSDERENENESKNDSRNPRDEKEAISPQLMDFSEPEQFALPTHIPLEDATHIFGEHRRPLGPRRSP